jgi:hypothetical protein
MAAEEAIGLLVEGVDQLRPQFVQRHIGGLVEPGGQRATPGAWKLTWATTSGTAPRRPASNASSGAPQKSRKSAHNHDGESRAGGW